MLKVGSPVSPVLENILSIPAKQTLHSQKEMLVHEARKRRKKGIKHEPLNQSENSWQSWCAAERVFRPWTGGWDRSIT